MICVLLQPCLYVFLTQQVTEPTRNRNILDLMFWRGQYNKLYYCLRHFSLWSLYNLCIYLIPVHVPSTAQKDQSLNSPSTRIETLEFNKANWPKLKESLNTIDWPTSFRGTSVKFYLQVVIETISEKCTMYVPPKRSKRNKISMFHYERKMIMRKRLKLVRPSKLAPSIKAQLVKSSTSHQKMSITCNQSLSKF